MKNFILFLICLAIFCSCSVSNKKNTTQNGSFYQNDSLPLPHPFLSEQEIEELSNKFGYPEPYRSTLSRINKLDTNAPVLDSILSFWFNGFNDRRISTYDPLILKKIENMKNLMTLSVVDQKNLNPAIDFSQFQHLRFFLVSKSPGFTQEHLNALLKLKNIQAIALSGIMLDSLPQAINELKFLRSLQIKDCQIKKELPVITCPLIERLNIDNNNKLYKSIENHTNLRTLILRGNAIDSNINFTNLKKIETIEAYSTQLTLNSSVKYLENLKTIRFEGVTLTDSIAKELNECTALEVIDIVNSNLHGGFPKNLENLSQLKSFTLRKTPLPFLPDLNSKHLKKLNCRFCELSSIPKSIGQLDSLEHLNLNGNYIETIPKSVGNLKNLYKTIYLKNLNGIKIPIKYKKYFVYGVAEAHWEY